MKVYVFMQGKQIFVLILCIIVHFICVTRSPDILVHFWFLYVTRGRQMT